MSVCFFLFLCFLDGRDAEGAEGKGGREALILLWGEQGRAVTYTVKGLPNYPAKWDWLLGGGQHGASHAAGVKPVGGGGLAVGIGQLRD